MKQPKLFAETEKKLARTSLGRLQRLFKKRTALRARVTLLNGSLKKVENQIFDLAKSMAKERFDAELERDYECK